MAEDAVANGSSNDLGEDGAAEARPKILGLSSKRLALFVILPALVLGGGGAGAYFMELLGPSPGKEPVQAKAEDSGRSASAISLYYELPDMLVDLNSGSSPSNLLKLSIALEVEDEATVDRLHTVMPRVMDNFQVYLGELAIEDLSGSAGLDRLSEELLLRVNASIRPAKVLDVRFMEMLIQ
jgi:flagellar FliL protein